MTRKVSPGTCRRFCVKRLTNGSAARVGEQSSSAFTLVELLVVFGIILILAGLVLSTVGYARKKGARARAETEIAAMSAACEGYKADYANYPRPTSTTPNNTTDALDARTMRDPTTANYRAASLVLY